LNLGIQAVISPALGGLIIGHEVARALGVRAIFAERQEGVLTLRRGFTIAPGERMLVVEDVVTTGGSTRETMEVAVAHGATIVAAGAIIDRGVDVDLGVPFRALAKVSFPTWPADRIPDWLAAIPVTKPGSRPGNAGGTGGAGTGVAGAGAAGAAGTGAAGAMS
jgi:orotate phosphoribosyltransferase